MSKFTLISNASKFSKTTLACAFFMIVSVIAGCVSILMPAYTPANVTMRYCEPFVLPSIKPIPDIPIIPDNLINQKDKTDTILVNKIKELREYSKQLKADVLQANEKHLQSCR